MLKFPALCGLASLSFALSTAHAQSVDSLADKAIHFPAKLLGRIQSRTADLNAQLTRQTQRYLQKMAEREQRMKDRLAKKDSTAANNLFGNSAAKNVARSNRIISQEHTYDLQSPHH